MIIYYAMTKFHLIFSITHKLKVYPSEDAVLFLYSGLQDLDTNYSRLKEVHLFSEIYVIPEIKLRKDWIPLSDDAPSPQIEKNIDSLIHAFEAWLPITVSCSDQLFIANDHWALGTYCIRQKIPYTYYEDGVGMLSKPEYSYELVRKLNKTHATVAKYMGAFGQNGNVIKKLADLTNQTDGFQDEKAVHFSLKEQLTELSEQEISKLLYIFDAPDCGDAGNATILLTEHFVNMKRLTIEGQRELYALLIDFFAQGSTLYIKPHPNDFAISYPDIFPHANMISRKFPSELLPYCFKNSLLLALAACSTSVYGLQDVVKNTLRFDITIEDHYTSLIKYYSAGLILNELSSYTILAINAFEDLLDAFHVSYMTDSSLIEGPAVILMDTPNDNDDSIDLSCLHEDDILIYLDSSGTCSLFENNIFSRDSSHWIVIAIRKKTEAKNFAIQHQEEAIWIYAPDAAKLSLFKHIKEKKKLENTGMILDIEAITDDSQMQVKLLEGNLKAATLRIEKYKEAEIVYKQQIQELEGHLANHDQELLANFKQMIEEQRNGGLES